jgi:hypothetical protein
MVVGSSDGRDAFVWIGLEELADEGDCLVGNCRPCRLVEGEAAYTYRVEHVARGLAAEGEGA